MFILFTDSFFCMIYVSNVSLYYSLKFDQNKKLLKKYLLFINLLIINMNACYKYM